jgi:hypothetical protein
MLAALVVASLVVPVGAAQAAPTVVVDADGAASVASCDAPDRAHRTISAALAELGDGATVRVCPGVVTEPGQVVLAADVTVTGADPDDPPTIVAGADTGTSGDQRGWWLVRPGADVEIRDLRLDGAGRNLHQALRFRGQGTVRRVAFSDIGFNPSGPDFSGLAVVAFGDGPVRVEDSSFRRIGRVGALFFGPGTAGSAFTGNSYTGKGSGTHLDYGVEVGQGARVHVEDNTITRARGSAQGAVSAGVLVSTAFGGGVGATVTGNRLTHNANGVFVDDQQRNGLGPVSVERNAFGGNTVLGVALAGVPALDATCNWWGASDGPRSGGGSGDAAASAATVTPFLTSDTLDGRCASEPQVTPDTATVTVDEGSEAVLTGTFEAGVVDPVSLTASVGTVTATGGNAGTWTWRHTPADGPAGSRPVTVTASNGRTGTATFDLEVDNVAPTATFDPPSTAFADRPFRVALRDASDPSPADRAAGLTFAFDCGDGRGLGDFGSDAAVDCVVDRGGRRTLRGAVADRDGGVREFDAVVEVFASDGDGAPDRSASGTVGPGGWVSTGDGEATPGDPVTTRVRTPDGGEIVIEEGPPTGASPAEHRLLVWGSQVTGPPATSDRALSIVFRLDADLLPPPVPGTGLPLVAPTVDGRVVLPCASGSAAAAPDPCVASRSLAGDDLVLAVRSSRGAGFDFAEPRVACPATGVPAGGFADVDGNVHAGAIDCAAWWRVAQGVSTTSFAPHRAVTRAQVATALRNLLVVTGVTFPEDPPDRFHDDDGSVHERAIDQLAAAGVMQGRGGTTFAPDVPLSRAQLASVLARAHEAMLGEPLPDGPDRFRDDDGSVHEPNIDRLAAAGLAQGIDAERFGPHLAVQRGQLASFATRLLGVWYAEHRR